LDCIINVNDTSKRMLYIEKQGKGIVNGFRIAIIMLSSPGIPEYAHFAAINNYLYAAKHTYDFIVERQPNDTENTWCWDPNKQSSVSWYKAELLKRHLKNYDYILFIDSDAIFNQFEYSIENELVPLVSDTKCIIFQEDVWDSKKSGIIKDLICTGLIFVKRCPEAFGILDCWIRAPYENEKCKEIRFKHPREQECIMHLINTNIDIKKHVYVYPASKAIFGQYDAKWILHMGGTNNINRLDLISRYCHAQYENFIKEINQKFTA
jgi:hypothetical protein